MVEACYRYQGGCGKTVEACLDNQPYHLVTEDSTRASDGLEPLHMAQRYSQLGDVGFQFQLTGPVEDRTIKIKYDVPSIQSSVLSLEFSADSLKFIEKVPPGEVCPCCHILFCLESHSSVLLSCSAFVLHSFNFSTFVVHTQIMVVKQVYKHSNCVQDRLKARQAACVVLCLAACTSPNP